MVERLDDNTFLEIAVLCEDVREEIGRKYALLGVMTGDIFVAQFPGNIRIAFLLGMRSKGAAERTIKLRLMIDDQQAFEGASVAVFSEPALFANTIVPTGILALEKPCQLVLLVSTEEGRWVEALRKSIMQGMPP